MGRVSSDSSYFRVYKRMEFGTKKSAVLTIKEDTTLKNIGIELSSLKITRG